jgi:hypothetical protein
LRILDPDLQSLIFNLESLIFDLVRHLGRFSGLSFTAARKLLKGLIRKNVPVRLIGVYAGNLEMESDGSPMPLFRQAPQKDEKLAEALDDITQRFGDQAIKRAALVKKKQR